MMVFPLLSHSSYENETFTRTKKDGTKFKISVTPPMCENVYSSQNWAHMLPFKATYNDYGFWENESYKDGPTKFFLDYLIENSLIPDDARSSDDFKEAHKKYKAQDYEGAMQAFGQIIHNSELYISPWGTAQDPRQYQMVKFAVIDMKVYKLLEQEKDVMSQIAQKTKALDLEIKAVEEAFKSLPEKDPHLALYSLTSKNCRFIKTLIEESQSYNTAYTGLYLDELMERVLAGKTDFKKLKKDFFMPAIKNMCIQSWIHQILSHTWAPVNYAGQNYSNQNAARFLLSVVKAAVEKDRSHEYDEIESSNSKSIIGVSKATFDLELIDENNDLTNRQITIPGKLNLDDFASLIKDKIELEVKLEPEKTKPSKVKKV